MLRQRLYNLFGSQCFKQGGDNDVFLRVMTKRKLRVDAIQVSSTALVPLDVPRVFQIGDDLMGGALGDPDVIRYLPRRVIGIAVDIAKHQAVVGDERPPRGGHGD